MPWKVNINYKIAKYVGKNLHMAYPYEQVDVLHSNVLCWVGPWLTALNENALMTVGH